MSDEDTQGVLPTHLGDPKQPYDNPSGTGSFINVDLLEY